MYLAVVAAITGQALAMGQPILLGYAAVWVTVASFARWYEEPPWPANSARRTGTKRDRTTIRKRHLRRR